MSITLAGTQDASVVVMKNLAAETSVGDIEKLLKSLHIVSTGVDRKVDSLGHFRGTAFVRFATPEIAHLCVDKLDHTEHRIHNKRVKAELLRQMTRGRSYSAREILEAGSEVDANLARVRDLITGFMYSDKIEMNMPTDLSAEERKLAHSLAEKFGLVHTTVNPNGEALDASPRHGVLHATTKRTVHLSKNRVPGSKTSSFVMKDQADKTHAVASFVTAAVTNDLHKITPLLPEVPVYAAKPATNLDHLAMMHAAQAQVHADAAKAALEAAKRSKEVDAMPDWLEVVDHKAPAAALRRAKSNLNPNAPAFIPSNSLVLEAPPGLTKS